MKRAIPLLTLLAVTVSAGAQETIAIDNSPRVQVVTNRGDFVIELDRIRAPMTVENFLEYVAEGHYNGTIFHRVLAGFIAQAGGYTEHTQRHRPAGSF